MESVKPLDAEVEFGMYVITCIFLGREPGALTKGASTQKGSTGLGGRETRVMLAGKKKEGKRKARYPSLIAFSREQTLSLGR